MKFLKIAIFQILILFVLFVVLELVSIKLFPEYSANQLYIGKQKADELRTTAVSKNKNQYFQKFKGFNTRTDLTDNDQRLNENYRTIWLFGDSVSNGYGLKYTDTFFYILKETLSSIKKEFNIFSISDYGNNLNNVYNIVDNNKLIFKEKDYLIFQFNYNDILPKSYLDKGIGRARSEMNFFRKFVSKFDAFRYNYLHRSTFFRVLTHYASISRRKTSGDCKSRDIDALGQYTFSYGSKNYIKESNDAWKIFEQKISKLKVLTKKRNLEFIVLISPISLQLTNHQSLNFHNFDLDCSAIDGRVKILEILNQNNIVFSDPLNLFEDYIKLDLKEKNFTPLFFEYDTNHPNSKGNLLMSISLLETIYQNDN
jgi:hypothetical protein